MCIQFLLEAAFRGSMEHLRVPRPCCCCSIMHTASRHHKLHAFNGCWVFFQLMRWSQRLGAGAEHTSHCLQRQCGTHLKCCWVSFQLSMRRSRSERAVAE